MTLKAGAEEPIVIGYEGGRTSEPCVNWGAAAVLHHGRLINGVSGLGRLHTEEELGGLIEAGYLSVFETPITLNRYGNGEKPLVVELPFEFVREAGIVNVRPEGILGFGYEREACLLVFENLGAFDAYRRQVTKRVAAKVLREYRSAGERNVELLGAALTLDVHSGVLNALRAFLRPSDDPAWAKKLGKAIVRGEDEQALFDKTYEEVSHVVVP